MSSAFGTKRPAKAHLLRAGGLAQEISLLRTQLEQAFTTVEAAISSTARADAARIIYRPGGTASADVVITFTTLKAAVAAVDGPVEVVFDDTDNGGPIILPAGTWTVDYDMRWSGHRYGDDTVVHLADGFRLTNTDGHVGIEKLSEQLILHTLSNAVQPFQPSESDAIEMGPGCKLYSDAAGRMFKVASGKSLILGLLFANTVGDGTHPLFDLGNGGTAELLVGPVGTVAAEVFAGTAGSTGIIAAVSSAVTITSTHTLMTGTFSLQLSTSATFEGYNDTLVQSGLLGGATSVQTAIDAIKTIIAGLTYPLEVLFDGAATGATDTFMACATGTSVATAAMRFTLEKRATLKSMRIVVWQNASLSADATVKVMKSSPAVSGTPTQAGSYTATIDHTGTPPYGYNHIEDVVFAALDGVDVELITGGTGTVRMTVVLFFEMTRADL